MAVTPFKPAPHCVIEFKMKSSRQTLWKGSHTNTQHLLLPSINVSPPDVFLPLKPTTRPFQLIELLLQIQNLFWPQLHGLCTSAALCFFSCLLSHGSTSTNSIWLNTGSDWTLSSNVESRKRGGILSVTERGKNILACILMMDNLEFTFLIKKT